MATVTGYVERIKYRNEDNGYSVLSVADGGEEYILVGTFPYISEGERIEATGRMVEHSIYGEQLAVESYELKEPEELYDRHRQIRSVIEDEPWKSRKIRDCSCDDHSDLLHKYLPDLFLRP